MGRQILEECEQAYINWIDNLQISGREMANVFMVQNGWVSHTTGNIYGHAAPIGDHPWGMYPMVNMALSGCGRDGLHSRGIHSISEKQHMSFKGCGLFLA